MDRFDEIMKIINDNAKTKKKEAFVKVLGLFID
jgi:hypothetical protein